MARGVLTCQRTHQITNHQITNIMTRSSNSAAAEPTHQVGHVTTSDSVAVPLTSTVLAGVNTTSAVVLLPLQVAVMEPGPGAPAQASPLNSAVLPLTTADCSVPRPVPDTFTVDPTGQPLTVKARVAIDTGGVRAILRV